MLVVPNGALAVDANMPPRGLFIVLLKPVKVVVVVAGAANGFVLNKFI